jgi:hypothetical protein
MEKKSYQIKFVAIELISKSISDPPPNLKPQEAFNFNFGADLRVDPEKKIAASISMSNIVLVSNNTEVANFKIICVFELPDFENVFSKVSDTKYDTPIELEIILKSASVSTLRGVIASEVKGTYLQGTVLPLIDMDSLVRSQRQQETSG